MPRNIGIVLQRAQCSQISIDIPKIFPEFFSDSYRPCGEDKLRCLGNLSGFETDQSRVMVVKGSRAPTWDKPWGEAMVMARLSDTNVVYLVAPGRGIYVSARAHLYRLYR